MSYLYEKTNNPASAQITLLPPLYPYELGRKETGNLMKAAAWPGGMAAQAPRRKGSWGYYRAGVGGRMSPLSEGLKITGWGRTRLCSRDRRVQNDAMGS